MASDGRHSGGVVATWSGDALSAKDNPCNASAELSVIVPTFNECENVGKLVDRLERALAGIRWEAVFVDDDSSDGTAEEIRSIARSDARVRCLQRIGRRGLSSACIEGMLSSSAPFIAVMDADLQHDESILPVMLSELKLSDVDIVVGSRYVDGGDVGDWQRHRVLISRIASIMSRIVSRVDLKDPMSGFFVIRRTAFMGAVRNLSTIGFKILLDLFASSPKTLTFREVPYQFRSRSAGSSKLDLPAVWAYILLILDKLVGRFVPIRFLSFLIIGGMGVVVHMIALAITFKGVSLGFEYSQAMATLVSMTFNFFFNNMLTYSDLRLTGWRVLGGLFTFYMACGLGAVANNGVAIAIFDFDHRWWLAGIVGVMMSAVWNYVVTSIFTWKNR